MVVKLSICIPVYNGEKYLAKTIDSILNQTYSDFELIIVDNASTDRTGEIIKKYPDPRVRYYRNSNTLLPQDNWSKCVQLAIGEFIALYHADDIYLPNIVEAQVRFLEKNNSVGVVFTEAFKINSEDKVIGTIELPRGMKGKEFFSFKDLFVQLIRNNYSPLVCPTCMARKSVYEKVGLYNSKDYKYVFDTEMYLRMAEVMDLGVIAEKLIKYRIHATQGSNFFASEDRHHNEIYDMYDKFIEKHEALLSSSDLSRYECFKRWDYTSHAIRALCKGNVTFAKELLKKSFSFSRFVTSFSDINLFIRLMVSIMFLLFTYLGVGPFFARLVFSHKIGYV